MPTLDHVQTLLGNAELGRLLGVSRQRVSQIVTRSDFPTPLAVLTMGSIWGLDDVTTWASERGRTLHLEALHPTSTHDGNDGA